MAADAPPAGRSTAAEIWTYQLRKYFYDTEFIERGPEFAIELISIGIVCEDGREYYAISKEFDPAHADEWVQKNVLPLLPPRDSYPLAFTWKSRTEIAEDLKAFFDPQVFGRPELWAYYGAYDHVVFCQIFGTMANMPNGLPYYTRDLKQWCDSLGN